MNEVEDKWSWVVCGACFCIFFFVHGTVKSIGLFFASTVELWNVNRVEASWPFTLCTALEGFGILLTGISARRNTLAEGMAASTLLLCSAFALSSLTKNISLLTLLIGIVCGLCYGYITGGCFMCICQCFNRYRNIAMGITVSGSAMGSIALQYLYGYLIQVYSLNQVYLLVSGTLLQSVINIMLCRLAYIRRNEGSSSNQKREEHQPESIEVKVSEVNESTRSCTRQEESERCTGVIETLKKQMALLKHPVLYIYAVSFSMMSLVNWFWYIVIVDFAKDRGYTDFEGITLSSVSLAAGLVGRFSFGWTLDFGFIKRNTGLIVLVFVASSSFFMMPRFSNPLVLAAISGLYGLSVGAIATVRASIPATYFGVNNMSFALGLSGLLFSGASLLRPWLIGYFREGSGSYDNMFYMHGGMVCFAGVLWLMEPFAMKIHGEKKETQTE